MDFATFDSLYYDYKLGKISEKEFDEYTSKKKTSSFLDMKKENEYEHNQTFIRDFD